MAERGDLELARDILEAVDRITQYTADMSYDGFRADTKTQDAVVRNLEIVGEAAKALTSDFRERHDEIAWTEIARMRDRLIHHYFGVNWDIVWDVVQRKLPELRHALTEMLAGSAGR